MSAALLQYDDAHRTGTNVIDFSAFKDSNEQNQIPPDDIFKALREKPEFENYLKQFIEGTVYTFLAKNFANDFNNIDDPFDSIYIANLEADKITYSRSSLICRLSGKINDKSDEIFINDGLDD